MSRNVIFVGGPPWPPFHFNGYGGGQKAILKCAVNESTAEKLRAIAEETGEAVGDVVDFIVTDYIKAQERGNS